MSCECSVVFRNQTHEVLYIVRRRFGFLHGGGGFLVWSEVFHDVSHHAQRFIFVFSEVVGHAD